MVLFGNVISLGNLVWNLLDGHDWNLFGNLVLFSHVFSDSVGVGVIRGVSSSEFSVVTDLSPSVVKTTSKSLESLESTKLEAVSEEKEVSTSSSGSSGVSSGLSSGGIGSISCSLTISKLLGREDLFWLRFDTITRVIGVETGDFSLNWDVSGSGLVLNFISDGLLISEGSFVGNDWNFTGLGSGDGLVLDFIDGVDTGLLLNSVLSLVLNSHVLIEDGVVSGLSLLSVENGVLVGVTSLWLLSVLSDGVRSLEDLDLVSVSVLFFLSVEDLVVSFIRGEWNISVLGLDVVSVGYSWLKGVAEVVVVSVLDFIGFGVSEFLLRLILDLNVIAGGLDWDLSCSDFLLGSGLDTILDFVIEDFD